MELPQTYLARPDWASAQEPADWLTPAEILVWASWPSAKRRGEWLAGRLAAKRLLREAFGLEPLACEIGKEGVAPVVHGLERPSVRLSLSHCAGLGAASWSDAGDEGTVGVDAQWVRPVHPGLRDRVFRAEEQAQIAARFGSADDPAGLLLLWAIKEAAIKARRAAWGRALRDIGVTLDEEGAAVVEIAGEAPMSAAYVLEGNWWVARVVREPGPQDERSSTARQHSRNVNHQW